LQGLNATVMYHFTEYCIWVIAEFFFANRRLQSKWCNIHASVRCMTANIWKDVQDVHVDKYA